MAHFGMIGAESTLAKRATGKDSPTVKTEPAEERSFGPKPAQAVKPIIHPDFAARLQHVIKQHPDAPDLNYGLLTWIVDNLKRRFDDDVTKEGVRKWLSGEAKPRPDKMRNLAELLEADEVWLSMGTGENLTPKDKRVRNAMASGAVNVIAGFIQLAGGNVAFPEPGDKRADEGHIDLYAIIKGAQYAFHVSVGVRLDGDRFRFTVPSTDQAFRLGVLLKGASEAVIFEIPSEMLSASDHRRASSVDVILTEEEIEARAIRDFTKRL